ncbi:MAG TPA: prepilin-type N-terminal cleavage/methylation domain-containing protein [Thiolapillus brandeum]|uniref:Prepilin-type N-terminal cleavage/methylation domain-containing protein n=1 Tax=Thiolapillus brandeum TaxID=1076588 RepID=A0A831KC34_9GAMM|nr:prepilin-type N-terminal cleavage/methylation domain-containing protein [Thiolapillus brandeum]
MKTGDTQQGFTLVELIISLALIGLMTVLLFGALRFAGRAWDVSESRLERNTSITMVWQYLSDRFRQARALSSHVESEGANLFFFKGEDQVVEFVSPMPAHLGSGGLYIIRLQKGLGADNTQLILRRWLYHPEVLSGDAGVPEWRPLSGGAAGVHLEQEHPELRAWYSESVLADDIEDLRFSYYGVENRHGDFADWTDKWDDRPYLPLLVRMEIKDKEGSWPQMTFELPGY